jgi:hypothetical protein
MRSLLQSAFPTPVARRTGRKTAPLPADSRASSTDVLRTYRLQALVLHRGRAKMFLDLSIDSTNGP